MHKRNPENMVLDILLSIVCIHSWMLHQVCSPVSLSQTQLSGVTAPRPLSEAFTLRKTTLLDADMVCLETWRKSDILSRHPRQYGRVGGQDCRLELCFTGY